VFQGTPGKQARSVIRRILSPMSRSSLLRVPVARTVTAVAAVALALTVSGVASCGTGSEPRATAPKVSPTPIAKLNTGAMKLARVEFCPLLPSRAVTAALDGRSTADASWSDGDKALLEDGAGLDDVVHEYGCRWTRSDQGGTTSASAWMFARTLTRRDARGVMTANRKQPGCRVTHGPGFGSPSQLQLCTTGGVRRARVAGLFGDSWLTCQVSAPTSVPAPSLTRRTDAWCVQVANATNTTK
jgi:hypothetical protein